MNFVIIMPFLDVFIGAAIGAFGKILVDSLWTTECWQRYYVRRILTQTEPIELYPSDVVPFDDLIDILCTTILSDTYGIFVLAGPAGSGKSTFMKMTKDKLHGEYPYTKVIKCGSTALMSKNIHQLLKIPIGHALSDYLPTGTLIIVDQIDVQIESFATDVQYYITELAADSVNSGKFKLIFCVSDPTTAKEILGCNGGDKIQPICASESLKWTDQQLAAFIAIKLPNFNEQSVDNLKQLAASCGNPPGLIVKASFYASGNDSISSDEWKLLSEYAHARRVSWSLFSPDQEASKEMTPTAISDSTEIDNRQ